MNIALDSESDPWLALEVLDLLSLAIAVAEDNGKAVFINRSARKLLNASEVLSLSGERIVTNSVQETAILLGMIRKAADVTMALPPRGKPPAGPVSANDDIDPAAAPVDEEGGEFAKQLSRASSVLSVPRGCEKRPCLIFVLPLSWSVSPRTVHRPVSVLFIVDPDESGQIGADLLREIYGLTPAEARLTQGILFGQSLQEFADAAEVSINTVRTQLKQVFAKTGTRRQVDLMRVLMSGLAQLG